MTVQALRWSESPLLFGCEREQLLGMLCRPDAAASDGTGVLIVVGGPQYRAGSHRQFTLWARALACAGHACLRFDARGMGDSSGAQRSFENLGADVDAALDAFAAACPGLNRFVLCGLCDGASAALLYLDEHRSRRIAGVILLNPWVHQPQAPAQSRTLVKHYYLGRLLQRSFWLSVLRGRIGWTALRELGGHLARALGRARPGTDATRADAPLGYADRMARGLGHWGGPTLLALSGEDLTAREFSEHAGADPAWRSALERAGVERLDLPGADHTLSKLSGRLALEAASVSWLDRLAVRGPTSLAASS